MWSKVVELINGSVIAAVAIGVMLGVVMYVVGGWLVLTLVF